MYKIKQIPEDFVVREISNFNDDYDVLFNLATHKIIDKNLDDQKILMKYINHFRYRGFENNIILKVIKNMKKI